MRNSGTGSNRFAFVALVAVSAGFALLLATIRIPDSPSSALPIVGNIMVFALVAHIALPQVVAVLSLKEQFRRVSSCIIDGKYWAVLWLIFASVLLCIAGALLADGGSLGTLWEVLPSVLSRGVAIKSVVVFAAVALMMFVAYLTWLLPSASSTVAILDVLTSRIEAAVRKGRRSRVLEGLDNLTAIGREASSALARGHVIRCLLRIGKAASAVQSEKLGNRVLVETIEAIDTVVRSDDSEKSATHSIDAIDGLAHLFRDSTRGVFDDDRFIAAIHSIALFAVVCGLTNATFHGINKLADIARMQLRDLHHIRVSLSRLAYQFDLLAQACLAHAYPQGARRILTVLLRLTAAMAHASLSAEGALDAVSWHAVSVCSQLMGTAPTTSLIPSALIERVWEATSRYPGSLDYAAKLSIPNYKALHSCVRIRAWPPGNCGYTCDAACIFGPSCESRASGAEP